MWPLRSLLALLGAHSLRVAEHWRRTGHVLGDLVAAHHQLGTEGCTHAQLVGTQAPEGWMLAILRVYVERSGLPPAFVPQAQGVPVLELRGDGVVVVEW